MPIGRLLGIALGGVSLTLLALKGFGLHFGRFFMSWVEALDDDMHKFFHPLEVWLIQPVLDYVHTTFDIELHVQPYWHHAFVLLWLLFGATARALTPFGGWGYWSFMWVWGFIVALGAGAVTGAVPLDGLAIFAWPYAGFFLWVAGLRTWDTIFEGRKGLWVHVLGLLAVFALFVDVATENFYARWPFSFARTLPSPGLAALASFIFIFALIVLIAGMIWQRESDGDTRWQKFFNSPFSSTGFDILCVFGVAAFFAMAGMLTP